ncbi:hypothetical protein BLEM_1243 [Bifidobacterium lemurum]|uniref:Uncharacterized protein n=1 Tax=Bifidobacterium lemurum TaxID=1603886 RepID=A0A261FRW5_9BIFI|nr:hypothetical protein BLEM_1243 [Bifidobacterium lemurum]
MATGGGMFSAEEVRYLRKLPAVANATRNRIMYSEAFKRSCLRRYFAGESPVKMFREAGLDPSLVGYKRIERCFARWKEQAKKEGVEQYLAGGDGDDAVDFSPESFALDRVRPVRKKNRGGGIVTASTRMSRDSWEEARDLIIAQQAWRIDQLEHRLASMMEQDGADRTDVDLDADFAFAFTEHRHPELRHDMDGDSADASAAPPASSS